MKWVRGRAALSTTLAGAIVNRMRFGLPIIAGLVIPIASQGQVTAEQAGLIDEGFRLFTQETFGGNGRTCGTCHVPSEGYNIFPRPSRSSTSENEPSCSRATCRGSKTSS